MPRLAALLVLTASLARAQEVSFDQGIDAGAVLTQLSRNTNKYYRWATRDCVTLTVPPGGPAASQEVWLSSTEYEQDCYYRGDPRSGGGRECYDRPARTHRERAQVIVEGARSTYPWERETFQACLEGRWLDVRPLETAYRYELTEDPRRWGTFIATPGAKVRMNPDPSGLTATLVNSAGSFAVDLRDKWSEPYAGEKVRLKLELWKHVEGWFDSKAGAFEVDAAVAPVLRAAFGGLSGLETGRKYYLKWTFRRVGNISRDTETKGNRTEAVFQPSAPAAGR